MTYMIVEDTEENQRDWMEVYYSVLSNQKEIAESLQKSPNRYSFSCFSELIKVSVNPISIILNDAINMGKWNLPDEVESFRKCVYTLIYRPIKNDNNYHHVLSMPRKGPSVLDDDDESTTDDEEFMRNEGSVSLSSPTIFNLKSFERPRKTVASISSKLHDDLKLASSTISSSTNDKLLDPPIPVQKASSSNPGGAVQTVSHTDKVDPLLRPGLPSCPSPEILEISSSLFSMQNEETLPIQQDPPPQTTAITNERQTGICSFNESVCSLDSFNSTIPLKETFSKASNHSTTQTQLKPKQPWFDLDSSKSKRSQQQQQSKSSNPGPKIMKQAKLETFTKKMTKSKTVDITSLKEFTGGSMSSQTFLNPAKRKSDEAVENIEKREKSEKKQFSHCEISPIKIAEDIVISKQEPMQTSHPLSPQPGSSTALLKKNKPLSPISPENLMKREKDKSKTKCSTTTGQKVSDFTLNLLKDFDKIPVNEPYSPKFKYKEPVVRKKNERAQLQGWDCMECKEYYEALESQMDENEIQRIKDRCSRHRSKKKPVSNTPENFWCTNIMSTEELYKGGYISVGTPFTPKPRKPRRRYSDSEWEHDDDDDGDDNYDDE